MCCAACEVTVSAGSSGSSPQSINTSPGASGRVALPMRVYTGWSSSWVATNVPPSAGVRYAPPFLNAPVHHFHAFKFFDFGHHQRFAVEHECVACLQVLHIDHVVDVFGKDVHCEGLCFPVEVGNGESRLHGAVG